MTKRKNTLMFILLGIIVIALVAVFAGCSFNDFINKLPFVKSISISVGDKTYTENTTGIVLDNGAAISVKTSADTYDVKVYPKTAKSDFTFTIGSDTWNWSDAVDTDFTSGFNILKDGKTFTVTYTNLATVIAKVLKYDYGDVKIPYAPVGDLFEMRITSDNKTLTLGFTLADLGGNVGVVGIELDTDGIVF